MADCRRPVTATAIVMSSTTPMPIDRWAVVDRGLGFAARALVTPNTRIRPQDAQLGFAQFVHAARGAMAKLP